MSNSVWQTANKKSLKGLLKMIDTYTLDPRILNNSALYRNTPEDFHPLHRADRQPVEYRICLPLLGASWFTEIEENKESYFKLKKIVSKHRKTEQFIKAVKEEFNCLRLEACIIYSNDSLKKLYKTDNLKTVQKWYSDIKGKNLYPIDKESFNLSDFKSEYQILQAHCEKLLKMGKIIKYSIHPKYEERHFLSNDEFNELLSLPVHKVEKMTNLMIEQAIRKTGEYNEKNYNFSKVALQSGRVIEYDLNSSKYCLVYREITPLLTKTLKKDLKFTI